MNRLKLRQKGKALLILLLSLALLSGLIFTAVRTIIPNGNVGVEAAANDPKNLHLTEPADASTIIVNPDRSTGVSTGTTTDKTGYGSDPQFTEESGKGTWGRTVSWTALNSQSDKAAYLRYVGRINAVYNGSATGVYKHSSSKETTTLGTHGQDPANASSSGNKYSEIFKLDTYSNSTNNTKMVWWSDIEIPAGSSGIYDFKIAMNLAAVCVHNGKNAKFNFFAIAYSEGTPGRINATSGNLVELVQSNTHILINNDTSDASERKLSDAFTYQIPTLKNVDFAQTKFLRVGMFLNGNVKWQHAPVITQFDYAEAPPAQITSKNDLVKLQTAVNAGYDQEGRTFTLANNLDLGSGWISIGQLTASNYQQAQSGNVGFKGTFDGGNHKITFSQSGVFTTGLFGVLKAGGIIQNLAIGTGTLKNNTNTTANGNGVFTSWCFGTIQNVVNFGCNLGGSATDKVKGASGSIAGYMCSGARIENAVNFGNIWYDENNASTTITHPNDSGQHGACGGGLVGLAYNCTITKVANYGTVSTNNAAGNSGGIVGGLMSSVSISDAYNYGAIVAKSYAGGIVAYNYGSNNSLNHTYQAGSSSSADNSSFAQAIKGGGNSYSGSNNVTSKPTATSTAWSETDWAKDSAVNGGGVYLKVLHNMLVGDFKMVTLTRTLPTTREFEYDENVDHKSKLNPTVTADWSAVSNAVKTIYTSGGTSSALLPTYFTLTATKDGSAVNQIKDSGDYNVSISYKYGCYTFTTPAADTFTVTVGARVVENITSVAELELLQIAVNKGYDLASKTFYLMNDLDLSGINWTPIGALSESHYSSYNNASSVGFAGTFDGQGYRIKNFTQSGVYATGLFGVIKSSGKVMNLAIESGTVNNNGDTKVSGNGVFASWCFGTIENVVNFGVDVGTETSRVAGSSGGIVGYLGRSAHVTNAVNFGNVYALSNYATLASNDSRHLPETDSGYQWLNARTAAGGIFGVTASGNVTYAANYGNVSIIDRDADKVYARAGGIGGSMYFGGVNHAYNYGTISATSFAAGIVARRESNNTYVMINHTYQGGTVTGAATTANIIAGAVGDSSVVDNNSETKPTELTGAWSDTSKFATDSGINAGGVYLIELHNMLVNKFAMVEGSATVASDNIGEVANGTDRAGGLLDRLIHDDAVTWISDDVKNAYTQNAEPAYGKLGITFNGEKVDEIKNAGIYRLTVRYGYGTVSFIKIEEETVDEVSLYLYNVKTDIENINDLKLLRDAVNGGIDQKDVPFRLMNDLDMSSEDWRPIGEVTLSNYQNAKIGLVGFAGTFNGQGHKLTGFKQTATSNTFVTGLFGVIKTDGTVMNLGIDGTTPLKNTEYISATGNGVFAAWCFGAIENVVNFGVTLGENGSTKAIYGTSGGIVGYLGNGGRIENAVNFGNVFYSGNYVNGIDLPNTTEYYGRTSGGGIVGVMASGSTVTNVANYGVVFAYDRSGQGSNSRAGGIAGAMYGASISNAYNYGTVYSQNSYAGGIVAWSEGGKSTNTLDHVYQGGEIHASSSAGKRGDIIFNEDSVTVTNFSTAKPTELDSTWMETDFGVDTAIHAGGVYLKGLHGLLARLGAFDLPNVNVRAKTTSDLTENYTGTDYASGLAIEQFTVYNGLQWISGTVRNAYTCYATEAEIPYAKLTITKNGENVTEIINVGTYSVSAVYSFGYSFGYSLYVEADEFTFTVNKATGSWSKTEGEYTSAEQDVTFGFGMTLPDVTMVYSYRLKDSGVEFTDGLPTDAGTYVLRVEISGDLDVNNFESGSDTETQYTVHPKTVYITWTGADENNVVTTTYNGQEHTPAFTSEGIFSEDASEVTFQYVKAVDGFLPDVIVNASTTLLKLRLEGDKAHNYTVSDNPVTFVVAQRVLNVSWEGLVDGKVTHEFDGRDDHLPTPVFTDENGHTATLFAGEHSVYQDEGNSFTQGWRNATSANGVTLTLSIATGEGDMLALSPNYDLQGDRQVVFVVTPKTVTGTWSDVPSGSTVSTFEYNGQQQAPTFKFADGMVVDDVNTVTRTYTYVRAEDNKELGAAPMDAGAYIITVSLDGRNAGNYVVSESLKEQDFVITKKQYTIEWTALNITNGTFLSVNTVGEGGQWKVDRKAMYPVTLTASVDINDTETPLIFSGDAGTFVKLYTMLQGDRYVTSYSLVLPNDDNVSSVTVQVDLPEQIKMNYEYKAGETAPEAQTILLKRSLTHTLSTVDWTYGEGEKITHEGKDYYVSTTKGNLEYSDGWTATVADDDMIPYYEFVRGTGSDANIEWMKLAIGKAGTTTITLTHAESAKYLETTQTVTVTYARKNVQFNARDLRGSYGEKIYTAEDFLITPTLAYEDKVETTFNISSNYDSDTMKDVNRVDGEVAPYSIEVTIKENPNYTLNGKTGDLTLPASLTVLPKALTVYATSYTRKYTEALPTNIDLTYDGFIDGENIGNIKDKDPSFEAPTAAFPTNPNGGFLDVNRYEFELTGGSAKNYQFTLIGGTLTITKGSLTGVTGTKFEIPYNAAAQTYAGTISVTVPTGGTPLQDGYSYAVTGYLKDGVEVSPTNAGTYDVMITVYTAATDNYANYDATLSGVFVIGKVTPYLNPTVATGFVYNGLEQRGVSAEWGLAGGTGTGKVKYTYYYQDETVETEHPIHAGTYRVEVKYVPGENDNYFENSTEVSFSIAKANMRISFDGVNTPYDAKYHQIENLKVAGVGTFGSGEGAINEADITDKVNLTVTYRQGGRALTDYPKNAGMYTVEVAASPKAGAFTYDDYEITTLRTESAVVISQVQIKEIKFEASTVNYDGTNKEPLKPAVAVGVEGDKPEGTFRYDYKRIGDTVYTAYARGAGKYDVRVTYVPKADDNYTAGNPVEFIGTEDAPFFEILRAPVTIRLNRVDVNFTGEGFPATAILNSTVAGEEPQGDVVYQYYYYDGENKVDMGDTRPRNAGTYGVTVTYVAVANDNFLGHTVSFDDYIVIRPIAPGISLVSAIHNFDGTPKGANEATLRGGAADQDGPKQTSLIYLYYVQGNWTSERPTEVGRYNVNVRYRPASGEINYIETDRTFNEGVIIDKRRPTIDLDTKVVTYDGNGVLPYDAKIGDGTSAKGVVMYEYAQSTTWSVSVPVNVGTYSVRVIYRATADDNYASEVKEFRSALVIEPAELDITPVVGQYKVYDGLPISEIQFNRPQLAPGNQWQGELYAPGVDEGDYDISIGTLTAGKNYNIKFTSGVKYRIEKRTVYFSFADINPVYDGMYKQVSVSCDGVLDGEDPLCTVSYEGDRMNVGSFKAIATVAGKNYKASVNNYREYSITPASMGEIPFANSTVRYDGKPHSILVYAAPDGSKVTYESAHTFTEIGAYIIRAKVTKDNYFDVDLRATLVIQKGATKVSVSLPSDGFRYGDALPQLTAVGDPGIATLDEGQTLIPGERDYNWTFTPLDSAHYETVKGTITIRVVKATADISLKGSLRQEENNTYELATSVPEELQGEVKVAYFDSKGFELKARPTEAGNYTVRVTYAGDDYYEAVSYDKQLVITEKRSMSWLLYVVIGIVVLAVASGIFFNTKRKIK